MHRLRLRFCAVFLAYVGLLALIFKHWEAAFGWLYLYPVSYAAAQLLDLIGLPVGLDASSLSLGFCRLLFGQIVFRIIFECTGIFTLLICLAAILAYPSSLVHKAWGVALGCVSFFAYGVLRLVLLGVVVWVQPEWISFFHVYFMVLLNLGFMVLVLAVWTGWVNLRG